MSKIKQLCGTREKLVSLLEASMIFSISEGRVIPDIDLGHAEEPSLDDSSSDSEGIQTIVDVKEEETKEEKSQLW